MELCSGYFVPAVLHVSVERRDDLLWIGFLVVECNCEVEEIASLLALIQSAELCTQKLVQFITQY